MKYPTRVVRETNFYEVDKRTSNFVTTLNQDNSVLAFFSFSFGDDRVNVHFKNLEELREQIVSFKEDLDVALAESGCKST